VHDAFCGFPAFMPGLSERPGQRRTGVEFAPKMIIKWSLDGEKIAEILNTVHPNRRNAHAPRLKMLRDG
jgi:hypothetical protein